MPLDCPKGKIRYRIKRQGKGKAVRLAFCGNKAIEATPMKKKGGKLKKIAHSKRMKH